MKVTSAFLETMRGKIGGAVASKARGGIKYFRALVTPSNPRTTQQSRIRAILTGIAAAWTATLTTPQRAAWSALARDQESGIDVYAATNSILVQGGTARQDTAPGTRALAWSLVPATANGLEIANDGGSITIQAYDSTHLALPATYKVNVYVQNRLQPHSRGAMVGNFIYAGTITVVAATLGSVIFEAIGDYAGLAGMTIGSEVYVRLVGFKSTGEVTGDIIARLTAVAP